MLFFCAVYFFVSYVRAEQETVIACENESISISCESGFLINVLSANYGRTERQSCPISGNAGASSNTDCVATGSFSLVRGVCHGKQTCTGSATNSLFGGDPCAGTAKYLNVSYECVNDWPIVKSKDGTVSVKNVLGEVHVSGLNLNVYGNMNVTNGDILTGSSSLSVFKKRIAKVNEASETISRLQAKLDDIPRPPMCMPPGADSLQFNGTSWICVCNDEFSGTSCTDEYLTYDGGDKDNFLLLGDCESHADFVPERVTFMGSSMGDDFQGITSTVFVEYSEGEEHYYIAAYQSTDDYCKMVQFTITSISGKCNYKPLRAGYVSSPYGENSVCVEDNIETSWASKRYNDLATSRETIGYGIETIKFRRFPIPDASWHTFVAECLAEAPDDGDCRAWSLGNFFGTMSKWDTSLVTNMTGWDGSNNLGLSHKYTFNGDISNWDVSQVTNMESMFNQAISFNQNISNWTGPAATTAQTNMFTGATTFQATYSCVSAIEGPASSCVIDIPEPPSPPPDCAFENEPGTAGCSAGNINNGNGWCVCCTYTPWSWRSCENNCGCACASDRTYDPDTGVCV